MKRMTGRYERTTVAGEAVDSFIPLPLPPSTPVLELDETILHRLAVADAALKELDRASDFIPSLGWFLYTFVRKEAVVSSQIEGTQATLVDLLHYESEATVPPSADIQEICNYIAALAYAREEIASPNGLPISIRLLNDVHRRLMKGVRGAGKLPGEVRRSQNWIGGSRPGNARFVPPPPHSVDGLLHDLEEYIHAESEASPLVRAGLIHVQFETIHPYLDGNGRMGRLLVTLLLEKWNLLRDPLLYLSLHFKRHRAEYYRRLEAVRVEGDWEGWLDFFLDGVATIAEESLATVRELSRTVEEDRERVLHLGTTSVAALRLFDALPDHPIVTATSAMRLLEVSKPTAGRTIDRLVEAGVLVERSGRRRDRWYAYGRYLDSLRSGTE